MKLVSRVDSEVAYIFLDDSITIERNGEYINVFFDNIENFANRFRPDIKRELIALSEMQLDMNYKMKFKEKPFSKLDKKSMLARTLGVQYSDIQTMVDKRELTI